MIEWVISVCLVMGGFFMFVAGLGVLRLSDTLMRMHASTKAGALGVGLIIIATTFYFNVPTTTARAVAIFAFLLLTAPVAAHLIGRTVYRSGLKLSPKTVYEDKKIEQKTPPKKKPS